jgi:hypothetical protein
MTTNSTNRKRGFLNIINKVFTFLRACIEILFSIVKNAMTLLVYLFRYIVELLAHPTMPAFVAIIFFSICVAIAGVQWYGIGVWLFQMFGLEGVWGFGGGLFGLSLGFGINVYQLAPELWKLQPQIAKAYDDLNIDPEAELDKPALKERLKYWLTYDHGTLKGMRLMSYMIETGLVLVYTALVGQFQFWAICVAACSLLAPEATLKGVAATTGVTRAVSDRVAEMQDNEDEMKKFGF